MQTHIFATRNDLFPALERIEGRVNLKYVFAGNFFRKKQIKMYDSLLKYAELGISTSQNHMFGRRFLVQNQDEKLRIGRMLTILGISCSIDQWKNPNSIVFSPGGLYKGKYLICGNIATVSQEPVSAELYRLFSREIKKGFVSIGAFWVGPEALELLKSGMRLITMDIKEDPVYDLSLALLKTPQEKVKIKSGKTNMDYGETCRYLQSAGLLDEGEEPPLKDRMPDSGDNDSCGISFFRTEVTDVDLQKLTMPGTLFCRSEISNVSFRRTNLAESSMCWSNFIDVDFSWADLSNSDLRSSIFKNVRFCRANMKNVDLRHSEFENCGFKGAGMQGVKLTEEAGRRLNLSDSQRVLIDWQTVDGEVPDGG